MASRTSFLRNRRAETAKPEAWGQELPKWAARHDPYHAQADPSGGQQREDVRRLADPLASDSEWAGRGTPASRHLRFQARTAPIRSLSRRCAFPESPLSSLTTMATSNGFQTSPPFPLQTSEENACRLRAGRPGSGLAPVDWPSHRRRSSTRNSLHFVFQLSGQANREAP